VPLYATICAPPHRRQHEPAGQQNHDLARLGYSDRQGVKPTGRDRRGGPRRTVYRRRRSPEEVRKLLAVAREAKHRAGYHLPRGPAWDGHAARRGPAAPVGGRGLRALRDRGPALLEQGPSRAPKSAKGRVVSIPAGIASILFDHLAPEARADAGRPPIEAPLRAATYATLALASGKSLAWVAKQLGHSSPTVTLDFSHTRSRGRNPSPTSRCRTAPRDESSDTDACNVSNPLARREGLEPPTLRFEA
jgi:integrase